MKTFLYLFIFIPLLGFSQSITVSGTVMNANKESLPSVNINIKGSTTAVSSDFNGYFQLSIPSKNTTLVFSYLGYKTDEITIKDEHILKVYLEENAQNLDQVIVKGFSGIVGKARKRTESVQNIPESITALNSEGIEQKGITTLTSFAQLVPNLKLSSTQAAGVNFLTIRGIPQIRNGDAPVAFVIDGVTIPDPSLLNQELFDLALIEVVKGPQGALYGKNAIGGAINIYSKEPTNSYKNSVKFGYGNGNSFVGQFISSGAIKEDKLFYRLSSQYKKSDGLLTNDFLDKKVDFLDDFNIRGQLIAKFTKNFKASATAHYIKTKTGATYYSINPNGNIFTEGAPGGSLSPNPSKGNNIIAEDEFGRSSLKTFFTNANLEYTFDKVKIQSITSYIHVNRLLSGDLDFTPANDLTQGEKAQTKTFNQEIRINNISSNSKLNWSAGGFYQSIKKPFFQDGLARDYALDEMIYGISANVINKTKTLALFGFADYKLTSKLTVSAGFRYDHDEFSQEDLLFNLVSNRKNNIFQPKATLSYKASENTLLYTNYGRGYRTGGFNPAVTNRFNREFKDELSNNYEFGFKTSWWANRFVLNGALFYTNFNNQQQYAFDLNTFYAGNYNYKKSKITGFEIDTKLRISKYLDLLVNYGLVNSEIKEGGTTGGEDGKATDLNIFNGKKTPIVPVNNYNIGLESSFAISDKVNFYANTNLNSTGKIYWNETNASAVTSKSYQLLDARASILYNKMTFTLWGQNILNKQYYLEYYSGAQFGGYDDFGWRGRPATYGVSVSIDF